MPRDLIIGTRGSLLARTQTDIIKTELERLSGRNFSVKTLSTQGDQITDKPLWQLEGKDFFTKELDAALLNKEVDIVVHSYKDLGTERPDGIHLGAITKRFLPHDILLIHQETIEQFTKGSTKELIIGTSSPRRICNMEDHLHEFLPFGDIKVQCKTLRGNVNTRIQKLRDGQYHGIILAFAGLERLCFREDSRQELKSLLQGLNFSLLPLSQFPTAAAQGALGIECRREDGDTKDVLRMVHHQLTADCIASERKVFVSFGGGCHLAVGINTLETKAGKLHLQRGQVDEKKIRSMELESYPFKDFEKKLAGNLFFLGLPQGETSHGNHLLYDELLEKESLHPKVSEENNLFITSRHVTHSIPKGPRSLWSAGMKTWKNLCSQGYWVNGSSDSMGHEYLQEISQAKLWELFQMPSSWEVLTGEGADSVLGKTIPCYTRQSKSTGEGYEDKLRQCAHFYWTSAPQFKAFEARFPFLRDQNLNHYCGMGKTFLELRDHGINPHPVINMGRLFQFLKTR